MEDNNSNAEAESKIDFQKVQEGPQEEVNQEIKIDIGEANDSLAGDLDQSVTDLTTQTTETGQDVSSDGRIPLFDDLQPNKSRLARLYLQKHERKAPVFEDKKAKTLADLGM
jgi:hypothetical protein